MSDQRNGGILWADETWNPIRGCSKVSEGCRHCYAETMAARFCGPGQPYEGLVEFGQWVGSAQVVAHKLDEPMRWKRPRKIFVNSMSDLFHETIPFRLIAAIFGVMAACPRHTFQVLTKRPQRMLEFFDWVSKEVIGLKNAPQSPNPNFICAYCGLRFVNSGQLLLNPNGKPQEIGWNYDLHLPMGRTWPLPNVMLGVSVENQDAADKRIPLLRKTPAACRWLSLEPLLEPVDLFPLVFIDWVVVGGESGPHARPMRPEWVRDIRDQCVVAQVPFMFKQWGEWILCPDRLVKPGRDLRYFLGIGTFDRVGKKAAGRILDGREHLAMPAITF